MAQTSLSTAARSHLLRASRDDGQDVQVPWSTWMCENGGTYIPSAHRSRHPCLPRCAYIPV